ncbi:MAG TPA: DUF362 domain-containing protein [Phototrophicaceae bacterium]|nr:DUF362 domain-containing protein [Phototrophicaceae bacterium]
MSQFHLSRREFLTLTSAGLVSLTGGLPRLAKAADTITPPTVHLHTFDPAATAVMDAVQQTMLAATDLSWLKPGDSVFVKIACNSNLGPPSVTSPDVLAGVIKVLQDAGAGTVYVGDMSGAQFVRHLADGTTGSTRENMQKNGLLAAAEATGATVFCFEEVPFDQAYIPGVPVVENHHWGADLQVAEILDRVDHIINLPRLGKHVLAGASLGLKNAVGWISDHSRMVLHRDAATFHEKIAEINTIPQLANKLRLTLTLADQALTTYGPDAGYHHPLTQPLIITSTDIVSHDQVALLTLLWARNQTPQAALSEDPYPAQSNSLNWWFVRVTWDDEIQGYQELPTMDNLAAAEALTYINYAYDLLHGGRPETIEVIPGGLPLDMALIEALTGIPELHILLRQTITG